MTKTPDLQELINRITTRLSGNEHPIPFSLTYEQEEGGGQMVWAVYIEAEAKGKPRFDLITQALDPVTALRTANHRLARELSW